MAQTCEELNFDGFTLTDSQNLSNEIYIALTLVAKTTNALKRGPDVTNPITRHAAVTASAPLKVTKSSIGCGDNRSKNHSNGSGFRGCLSFSLDAGFIRIRWGVGQVQALLNKNNQKPPPSLGIYLNICIHIDVDLAAELVRPGVGIFVHFTGMPGAYRNYKNPVDQTVFDTLGKQYDKKRYGRGEPYHAQKITIEFT